jgi:gluconolactonase
MYPPPSDIPTTIFARLPDRFRGAGSGNDWVRANRRGGTADSFLEGPCFDRDGWLYVTDIPFGRVFRVDPQGEFELVAEYDGEPNGLKIAPSGRILITDYRRGILELEPASGTVRSVIARRWSETFKGVNDLTIAANGDLYFTDQGQTGMQDPTGRVYRYTAEGVLDLLLDTVPSPNGIVLNAAGSAVFVAATRGNAVWRMPLMPDGTVSKVGVFVQMSGGGGPDGLAMDEADNLVVAHAGLGSVWVFSVLGEPLHRIRSCTGMLTTNIAFGGTDRRSLYITESETGTILHARLPVPGRALLGAAA